MAQFNHQNHYHHLPNEPVTTIRIEGMFILVLTLWWEMDFRTKKVNLRVNTRAESVELLVALLLRVPLP